MDGTGAGVLLYYSRVQYYCTVHTCTQDTGLARQVRSDTNKEQPAPALGLSVWLLTVWFRMRETPIVEHGPDAAVRATSMLRLATYRVYRNSHDSSPVA